MLIAQHLHFRIFHNTGGIGDGNCGHGNPMGFLGFNKTHTNAANPPGQGYSSAVVDRLSLLLTAGRLGSRAKAIIVDAFDSRGNVNEGLIAAQQMIITTSEFHTTNVVDSTEELRNEPTFPQSSEKPYRAVINLFLEGGLDSFNMLTPYTCSNGLYESYVGKCALMKLSELSNQAPFAILV